MKNKPFQRKGLKPLPSIDIHIYKMFLVAITTLNGLIFILLPLFLMFSQ